MSSNFLAADKVAAVGWVIDRLRQNWLPFAQEVALLMLLLKTKIHF